VIWQVLAGCIYSLAGFLVGFLVGRITREVHEIRESVVPDTFASKDDHGQHATKLGVVVIILSLLTVLGATFTGVQAKRQADCQNDYNARFVEAFQARAKASDADRSALNAMILGLADTTTSQAERRAIFLGYVDQVKKSDATRKANPLPAPPDPRDLCGD
jgi:hypothetical protein